MKLATFAGVQAELRIVDKNNWPHKDGCWWRKDFPVLRRNHMHNKLVNRFDLICGSRTEPQREDM